MKLYDLGHVLWIQSQLIYHAMPRLGMEGIPAEKLATLEKALIGVKLNEVQSTITGFYQAEGIESPGVTPADLARVIAGD
jgi:hypothetical protein